MKKGTIYEGADVVMAVEPLALAVQSKGEKFMNQFLKIVISFGAAVVFFSGCVSPRTVVDPTYGKVKYEDLSRSSDPFKWKLTVEFQRNGQHFPKVDTTLRDHAERVLRASGLIVPTPDPTPGEIKVVLNNIADLDSARAKGFGTGFTFGLVGTTVTDHYEMEITISANGKVIKKTGLKHALHTTIGNASIPEGLEVLPTSTAFGRVVEQMLLNALKELQQSGELSTLQPSV